MTTMLDLSETRQQSLAQLVEAWLSQRGAAAVAPVVVREVEVLRAGRPGLLDVLAEVAGRTAHVVFGLHAPGGDPRAVGGGDDPVPRPVHRRRTARAWSSTPCATSELAPLVFSTVTGDPPPRPSRA